MAFVVAGCTGGKGKPVDLAAPVPQVEEEATSWSGPLSGDQQVVKELLSKNGYAHSKVAPTVIVVHKQSRKLTLYKGITPKKTYSVVLGGDPYNDKLCQGDQCTPEGVYRVVAKYPHWRWSRFILLDYPNTGNWLRFGRAKQAGKVADDADIGGEIGIHGTESDLKNLQGQNWTRGCISLVNQDVEEIYSHIDNHTLVVIQKR
jgi:murein L,D-transpeptidase YafK